MSYICSVEDAANELRKGNMIIMVDDEDRENEGDLVCAAEFATPDTINFMVTHGRGLVCLTLTDKQVQQLGLPMMSIGDNNSKFQTPFTYSIEAAEGVTTGISSHDRSHTILTAIHKDATPNQIATPGHIFPLRAQNGGVLTRGGQTEGSVDLAIIAGLNPAGVICEIMNSDGTMARKPELIKFAQQHNLKIISVDAIKSYKIKHHTFATLEADTILPTTFGNFKILAYSHKYTDEECLVLYKGTTQQLHNAKNIPVRIHSQCMTGDVFGSCRCDCQEQLHKAMTIINEKGTGLIIYQLQEGRRIGIINKLKAYELQEKGLDTYQANEKLGFDKDQRDYALQANILHTLGVKSVQLITNNPHKIQMLTKYGVHIETTLELQPTFNKHNERYLNTKKNNGHKINKPT